MFEVHFRALKAKGLSAAILAEGTQYDVAYLQDKNNRVEWEAFVRINANASKIWSTEELIEIGGAFFRSPLVRSILVPARLLFPPRGVFQWVLGDSKGLGKHMVPCALNTYRELGPDRAELDITFPAGYARCPEFFTISLGAFSGLPCALGMDPATVTMTEIEGGSRYEI